MYKSKPNSFESSPGKWKFATEGATEANNLEVQLGYKGEIAKYYKIKRKEYFS